MRRILSSFGFFWGRLKMELCCRGPEGARAKPAGSGRGNRFIMASPPGLIRFAGILFPTKAWPVVGSMIGTRAPAVVTVLEKSPVRSNAEGIVKRLVTVDWLRIESAEKKKNSL